MAKLEKIVHTGLDELRMQMLGAQVLFGFQMQGAFQPRFEPLTSGVKYADGAAFGLIVLTIGLLLAPACQHRMVERGQATQRILRVANRFAQIALSTFSLAIGLDVFVVLQPYWGVPGSVSAGAALTVTAFLMWSGAGRVLRNLLPQKETSMPLPPEEDTSLHEKVDQMLTEARIILPGAQALLGFQFVVTLTKAFAELPASDRALHFAALIAVALAIVLLLTPAAIHRLTFRGAVVERFHRIGSGLVTAALAPLALGMSADFYIAAVKMLQSPVWAKIVAVLVALTLLMLWYVVPLAMAARLRERRHL